jgi:type I restriction enzyme S subunit
VGNKQIPDIRFSGVSGDWKEYKLGKLIEISSAARVHKNEWTISGVRFFRSSDVVSNFNGTKNKPAFISYSLYEDLSKKSGIVQPGDVLVTGGGTIGIPYLKTDQDPLYFKDADLVWLKSANKINGYFLYFYFLTSQLRKYISSITHIGTISHYTITQVKDTPIILPEIVEQTKIGKFMKQLNDIVAIHEQELTILKQTKQGFLQKMFPKEGESIPEIRFLGFSEDWKDCRLSDIGSTYTGLSGKTKEDFGIGEGEFVTYMNVFNNIRAKKDLSGLEKVDISDGKRQNKVIKEDLLFTTSSETPEEVGMVSYWGGNKEDVYLNSFCLGYRLNVRDIDSLFLAYLLRSSKFRLKITLLAQGSTRFNLSKKELLKLIVQVPSFEEQIKIGNLFKKLEETIALHERELETLKQTKKAFLQKMFV